LVKFGLLAVGIWPLGFCLQLLSREDWEFGLQILVV
jgi:hypothetical protein